jgi:hypothetical protein
VVESNNVEKTGGLECSNLQYQNGKRQKELTSFYHYFTMHPNHLGLCPSQWLVSFWTQLAIDFSWSRFELEPTDPSKFAKEFSVNWN